MEPHTNDLEPSVIDIRTSQRMPEFGQYLNSSVRLAQVDGSQTTRPPYASFTVHSSGWLEGPGIGRVPCALGRNGVVLGDRKREGDGCSPVGRWPLLYVMFRPDRLCRPSTKLPTFEIGEDMAWCDAPGDEHYNQMVRLPYPSSTEPLWRQDGLYDLLVILGFNDEPMRDGQGSCIFWHVRRTDGGLTEGCIAVELPQLVMAIGAAQPGDCLEILADLPE